MRVAGSGCEAYRDFLVPLASREAKLSDRLLHKRPLPLLPFLLKSNNSLIIENYISSIPRFHHALLQLT